MAGIGRPTQDDGQSLGRASDYDYGLFDWYQCVCFLMMVVDCGYGVGVM